MKTMIEELGGCLLLILIGKVLLNVMKVFYSLVGAL